MTVSFSLHGERRVFKLLLFAFAALVVGIYLKQHYIWSKLYPGQFTQGTISQIWMAVLSKDNPTNFLFFKVARNSWRFC